MSYKNQIEKISKHLEANNLFYGFFNVPTNKPHRVYISNTSTNGNAYGKLVIQGKTWKDVYDSLITFDLTKINQNTCHEIPDNN